MKFTDYIKKLIIDYFIIFAIIVIFLTILRQIFLPYNYLELKDIFICMIGALLGDLPSLIFYSPKEISEKEMRIRIIIHFVALEAVLLTFGCVVRLANGIIPTIIFAFQIAVIYVFVRFLSWMDDRKAAYRINEKLKAMKDESVNEAEEG
jgi:hypothetical protein